jgi:hypothetical protein
MWPPSAWLVQWELLHKQVIISACLAVILPKSCLAHAAYMRFPEPRIPSATPCLYMYRFFIGIRSSNLWWPWLIIGHYLRNKLRQEAKWGRRHAFYKGRHIDPSNKDRLVSLTTHTMHVTNMRSNFMENSLGSLSLSSNSYVFYALQPNASQGVFLCSQFS